MRATQARGPGEKRGQGPSAHEDARGREKGTLSSALHTRGAGRCPLPGPWAAHSCSRPCPALACPLLLRSLATGAGAEGGRPSPRAHSCSSLGCALHRRALSVARARRAPVPAPSPAPLLLPRRHAAQQRTLPRARLRALSASASTTLALSIVVVGDGAEKERRCRARRRPFPRRGLRSWTTPCALSCVLCWLVSTPCACAPGLNAINIATARRSTAHRSSTRGPLNARLGLRRVLLPAAFHASRHEHVASAHRPPLLFFFGVACARQLHQHGDLGRVAPQARRCVLRRQPRRPAARVDRGAATLALRSAPGPSRYAPHCVLLLLARQGAPHRRGSLGERPSPRAQGAGRRAHASSPQPSQAAPSAPSLRSFNTPSGRCA